MIHSRKDITNRMKIQYIDRITYIGIGRLIDNEDRERKRKRGEETKGYHSVSVTHPSDCSLTSLTVTVVSRLVNPP